MSLQMKQRWLTLMDDRHLPGAHDQKTHGHGGGGGSVYEAKAKEVLGVAGSWSDTGYITPDGTPLKRPFSGGRKEMKQIVPVPKIGFSPEGTLVQDGFAEVQFGSAKSHVVSSALSPAQVTKLKTIPTKAITLSQVDSHGRESHLFGTSKAGSIGQVIDEAAGSKVGGSTGVGVQGA